MERNNKIGPMVSGRNKQKLGVAIPLVLLGSLIAGFIASTQYFAYKAAYDPALGANVGHVYLPWNIIGWAIDYQQAYPQLVQQSLSVGLLCVVVGILVAAIIKAKNKSRNDYIHGSARWADKDDIKDAGLLSDDGVYVGGWVDKSGHVNYLRHSGPEHVLCYAPTRSGKGVGLVIPTLLSWPHSAVIADLKGELWALTAGWRQAHAGNKVIRFEPASKTSASWNPMDEIRVGTEYEIADAQNLATLIVDPDGKGLESHWQKTAQALLVGVLLHAVYKRLLLGTKATLHTVDLMLTDPTRPVKELWKEMSTYKHTADGPLDIIAQAARDMLDRPDDEGGSVLSTAKSYLSLFRDPVVAANTSRCDFTIRQLMNHDDPVSLYIVTQPNDKARLRPLVRIMVNMIVRLLADKMEFENGRPKVTYKHRLLAMIDEFPSLGKLEILQESLAFLAGYGIKFYLICQDLNQLRSRETGYGPDETVTSNCHVQNAYPPNRIETAEHLSKLTGTTTIQKVQLTTSGKSASVLMATSVSRTVQDISRPLLTPDECMRMPGPLKDASGGIKKAGDMVIYVAGYPAIYGRQLLYFQDPVFNARAQVPAPAESDRLIRDSISVVL